MNRWFAVIALCLLTAACATPLRHLNGDAPTVLAPLAVQPPDAKVYLDGVWVGKAADFAAPKRGLPLTRGTHLLRFEADGYMTETVEVQAQEIMMTVEIRLLTKPAGEAKDKKKK
jgi:hypothetical protein